MAAHQAHTLRTSEPVRTEKQTHLALFPSSPPPPPPDWQPARQAARRLALMECAQPWHCRCALRCFVAESPRFR